MLSAAADLLVVEDDVPRVSVLGFCMGGHYVFKAAATDRFDAAVAFYGMLRTPEGVGAAPATASSRSRSRREMCPTLAFFGTNDPWTPAADIDALRAAWAVAATARSSSSKAPSTASCTTPTAPRTAPTTRPTALGQRRLRGSRVASRPTS